MTNQEFKSIQCQLRLTDGRLAELLGVTIKTINSWRCGRGNISGPAKLAMRILQKHPEEVGHWMEIGFKDVAFKEEKPCSLS